MAKVNTKVSMGGLLTEEDGVFMVEEFNSKGESTGKFNLSELLREVVNTENFKISFDTVSELDGE